MWRHVVERHVCCVQCNVRVIPEDCFVCSAETDCTAHNTHAPLRHAATLPNLYKDVILPSILNEGITMCL